MEVCRSKPFQCRFTPLKRSKASSKISCAYYLLEHLTYYTQFRLRQARNVEKCETKEPRCVLENHVPPLRPNVNRFSDNIKNASYSVVNFR